MVIAARNANALHRSLPLFLTLPWIFFGAALPLPAFPQDPHGSESPPGPIGNVRLKAYVDALNADDRDTYARFEEEHLGGTAGDDADAARRIGLFRRMAEMTGGLELYRIEPFSGGMAVALARQKRDGAWVRVELELDPAPPHHVTGFGLALAAPPPEAVSTPLSEEGLVDELWVHLESLAGDDLFSGAVLLARGRDVIFQAAYGQAQRGDDAATVTLNSRFRLASLAKMFTAVVIGRLADAGTLAFSDRLIDHLPDFPDARLAGRITLHHLLTHTSGIGPAADESWWTTRGELFAAVAGAGLDTAPGTAYSYSNAGYALLRRVAESASGRSYCDLTRREIFAPAGMDATNACTGPHEPGLAVPYTRGDDGHHGFLSDGPRRPHRPADGSRPDAVSSTVGDLHRFAQALLGDRLLRPQTRERVFTGHAEMPGTARYGYGFIVRGEDALRSVRHGGGSPGVSTHFELYPESGMTVVVLSNDDPGTAERVNRPLDTWLARTLRASPSSD